MSHPIRYRIAPAADGGRRLICAERDCGEGIVGARTGFTGSWEGGVHLSDYEAGQYEVVNYRPTLGERGTLATKRKAAGA